jgi:hypothetical protein
MAGVRARAALTCLALLLLAPGAPAKVATYEGP